MTGYRFHFNELLRCVLLAIVFVVFAALSFILIIALLSGWPKMLHRGGAVIGPW